MTPLGRGATNFSMFKLFAILLLLPLVVAKANECDAYLDIEQQYHCGKSGYPLKFGHKYCQKFIAKKERFSVEGQLWLAQVRECLISEVNSLAAIDCRELKKLAFESHGDCYEKAGFCELSSSDRKELYKMIVPQFWRVRLVQDGLSLLRSCKD